MKKYLLMFSVALLIAGAAASTARAGFATTLGIPSNLLEPGGWSVGDALSTHQIWDAKTSASGNLPDQGYDVAGASLSSPTHSARRLVARPRGRGNPHHCRPPIRGPRRGFIVSCGGGTFTPG